jgi:glycosyltransferase involved in cell wall biosynthesis
MSVVAVCVCTYLRPLALGRLLDALTTTQPVQGFTVDGEQVDVRLVVVENHPAAAHRADVEALARRVPMRVDYVVEPRRGIPQARNAAVRAALPDADYVVFIDDDELPEPGWLTELLVTRRRTGADIVTGPVLPDFAPDAPRWVVDGRFFERPRYADGEQIHYAWTSNVLIARSAFDVADPPFDERFGLAGGEDTYFFRQAHLAGKRIVWSDKALVREAIPNSRCTVPWLLRRAYRRGNTLSICMVSLEDSARRRAKRVAHAIVALAHGIAIATTAAWRGRPALVRGAARVCFAAGLAAGMTGHVYHEYERVHGD